MKRETLILGIEHEELLKEFLLYASGNLGSIKINEIIKKVNTSGVVSKFMYEAERVNFRLGTDDFLACIHSSRSFIFSKAETISIATIILLKKWNYQIGEPSGLSNDIYLNKIFFSILDKCDGFKVHLKSNPNFFNKFNEYLIKTITLKNINHYIPETKTDISFDSILCNAIKTKEKTEFRVNLNLFEINILPNEWKLDTYNIEKGAFFSSNILEEPVLVHFPYKLGSIINVYNSTYPSIVDSKIKIISYYIQRLNEVNQTDSEREGFGAYKVKIDELLKKDSSLDAEYCLFIENWINQYGGSLSRNEWLWVFEFEIEEISKKPIRSKASSAGLTEDQIKILLEINF